MNDSYQISLFGKNIAKELKLSEIYEPDADAVLYHGDRLELVKQIESSGDKATLIVSTLWANVEVEFEELVYAT